MEIFAMPIGAAPNSAGNKQKAPRPIPEAQIATLREAYERYAAGCPFKPGDIVTPRAGYGLTDAGEPHVVLEVAHVPHRTFTTTNPDISPASTAFGVRLDVRVACLFGRSGEVTAFWQESWQLEAYKGVAASD